MDRKQPRERNRHGRGDTPAIWQMEPGEVTLGPKAAGDFSPWLAGMQKAIRGERASDVPCDGCTACCTSSQFVHIGPDETDTLAHIPRKLLFSAPLLPPGHFVLGYDERGHCPMLIDNRCSIYEHRPRTCRTYDCRVFPATGVAVENDKPSIARQVERWRFSYPSEEDRIDQAGVEAAAAFIRQHPDVMPAGTAPANSIQVSVLAIQIHQVFLRRDKETGRNMVVDPGPKAVRDEVMRQADSRSAPVPSGGYRRGSGSQRRR